MFDVGEWWPWLITGMLTFGNWVWVIKGWVIKWHAKLYICFYVFFFKIQKKTWLVTSFWVVSHVFSNSAWPMLFLAPAAAVSVGPSSVMWYPHMVSISIQFRNQKCGLGFGLDLSLVSPKGYKYTLTHGLYLSTVSRPEVRSLIGFGLHLSLVSPMG